MTDPFNWSRLLIIGLALLILYSVLHFFYRLLARLNARGPVRAALKSGIHLILLIYEPAAVLLLATVFVLINLPFHGILALLVIVLCFKHIWNYANGRILKFDPSFAVGKQIETPACQGIISRIGRFGLRIKTSRGVRFIDYSSLIKQGYLLLSGEEISGYYQLEIGPNTKAKDKDHFQTQLYDRLTMAPYLDWNHKPELLPTDEASSQIRVKVFVKEEMHLYDLISLIGEWGYSCRIIKK